MQYYIAYITHIAYNVKLNKLGFYSYNIDEPIKKWDNLMVNYQT